MGDWPEVPLTELAASSANSLSTGPFGSAVSAKHFQKSGVPLIRGSNLSLDVGTRLKDDEVVFLDERKADEFRRSEVRRGDLVFTCWGTIGQVGLIDASAKYPRYIVSNKQMKLSVDTDRVDPLFLYYSLSSPSMVAAIQSIGIGSSVPGFNLGQLRSVIVSLPPLAEQRAIVEVLGALDDKIEANRRAQNRAESLARAELERAQQDTAEAAIRLGALVERVNDIIQPSELPEDDAYIGLEHMPRGSLLLKEHGRTQGLASAKAAFRPNDVLFGKLRPYFKKVAVAPSMGVCSTDILVLRANGDEWAVAAAVCASDDVIDYASAGSDGTRMPRVSWEYLSRYKVRLPGAGARMRLQMQMAPLLQLGMGLTIECDSLATLRDALLPMLLSGKLRVRGAEHLVEEVV